MMGIAQVGVRRAFVPRRPSRLRDVRREASKATADATAGMTSETARIPLRSVLSAAADAAARGCHEIRAVQSQRDARGNDALGATRKVADDSRSVLTAADLAAQRVMVRALRSTLPGVEIIGEEDSEGEEDGAPHGISEPPPSPLRFDMLDATLPDASMSVLPSELSVYLDPVDGTREFVEGRLGAVQCLVGIARRGRAIAGAVGLPFAAGDAPRPVMPDPAVVWGLVPAKSGGILLETADGASAAWPPLADSPSSEVRTLVLTTGDSADKTLAAAREVALALSDASDPAFSFVSPGAAPLPAIAWRHRVMGGAGNKLLALATGAADVAIMHMGTSLWDTAAPEAVLCARGGKVTDLYGAPLVHDHKAPTGLSNGLGVLATGPGLGALHAALCAAMRRDARLLSLLAPWTGPAFLEEGGGAMAADVARDLDGAPLSCGWLASAIAPGGTSTLAGYAAPEAASERGLMSDGCRLELRWNGSKGGPPSAFYKRVVMGDLAHARLKAATAPNKVKRDVRSYQVEASFLGSEACAMLVRAGVPVARAYAVDMRPDEEAPIESRFAMLLEEFRAEDGWKQHWLLDPDQAKASLAGLAKLHAFFWDGSSFWKDHPEEAKALEAAVWPSGAYWQPEMQSPEQLTTGINDHWPTHCHSFAEAFAAYPALKGMDVASIGKRLQRVAAAVGKEAHPFGAGGPGRSVGARTLIHGDPKAANIFMRQKEASGYEIGFIDFQWSGFGLAATDVAHHIVAALRLECLVGPPGEAEKPWLDHYHANLLEELVASGAAKDAAEAARSCLPREKLQEQYDAAVLDMCRCVFSYQWARVKASPASLAKNAKSMGRNAYNKSVDHACWLVAACDAILKRRDR